MKILKLSLFSTPPPPPPDEKRRKNDDDGATLLEYAFDFETDIRLVYEVLSRLTLVMTIT